MKATLRNTMGVSTLSLVLLMLVSGTAGAVLSYLWTVGYYVDVGLRVPEDVTTVTITNVTFSRENSSYFNVAVLNPTYSDADARVTLIALIAGNNFVPVASMEPPIPYPLRRGEDVTFKCNLNWGEYAGQNVTVTLLVEEGSGATRPYQTELVKLEITDFAYNTAASISQFNVTVQNLSNIPLDVSKVLLGVEEVPSDRILVNGQNITFPYRVLEGESTLFACSWELWDPEANSGYLGATSNIVVETSQGYRASHSETFSDPVILTVSNVTYPELNTTQFILENDPQSPHNVNLTQVTLSVENETFTVADTNATGIVLEKGVNVMIHCEDARFNWEDWQGQTMTIRVYTTQGFLAKREEPIPSE